MEEIDQFWGGTLTTTNIDQVANLLRQLLNGKRFTMVESSEDNGFRPIVHTSQELKLRTTGESVSVFHEETGNQFAGFTLCHSGGVWGCSTTQKEDCFDSHYTNPYFRFKGNQVTITYRSVEDSKMYLVLAIEND